MASDWIKFEKETLVKQEVIAIATKLVVSHGDALLGCLRWWCWCDSNLVEGVSKLTTTEEVDFVAGIVGFGDALLLVGWLDNKSQTLRVPYFDRHMGESAKRRAADRNRKQKIRRPQPPKTNGGHSADK